MGLTLSTDKQDMGADREHIRAYILSRRHKLRPVIRQTYTFFCTCLVVVVSGSFKEIAWTSALILYVKDKLEPLSSFLFKESHKTDTGAASPTFQGFKYSFDFG